MTWHQKVMRRTLQQNRSQGPAAFDHDYWDRFLQRECVTDVMAVIRALFCVYQRFFPFLLV
jgi:hypothetical protein